MEIIANVESLENDSDNLRFLHIWAMDDSFLSSSMPQPNISEKLKVTYLKDILCMDKISNAKTITRRE